MEVIERENVKVPNSLIVSGITNTERDNDLTEHLSRYGCIGRIVAIDNPESPYHKNVIIEYESGSALKSLEPQLPFIFESPHQPNLRYEIKALSSIYVQTVASSVTKGFMEELKRIAMLSGKSFEDILNEELSKCTEPVSRNEDESRRTVQPPTMVNAMPEIQTDLPRVSQVQGNRETLTNAAFVPLTRMSIPNVNPPEVQRVVVEHIVKSEDAASHMHAPLKLKFFSGRSPRPGNEVDYDTWHNSVELMLQDPAFFDLVRSRKIIDSLLPPAADIVRTLGSHGTPRAYIDLLDSAFGAVEDGDDLFAKFLNTLQDAGERPSQFLQRLQVALTLAIKRGGVSSDGADRHLLRQFCRGCWDNALISEFQLEQKKTDPPSFSELLLLLRTAEDKQSTKESRMKKHLGTSKQRTSSYSLYASSDEVESPQTSVSDLKKQISLLQGHVESLRKAKEQTKDSHESMVRDLQKQVAELQSQIVAVKPTKSVNVKHATKVTKSQSVQTNLNEVSHSFISKQTKPKPWYCFRCGEDGHIVSSCDNAANPALVASKRKLLKEKQATWETTQGSYHLAPLN